MHLEIYIAKQCPYCTETPAIAEHARSIASLEVTPHLSGRYQIRYNEEYFQ